jgi:hypothetical protein
MFVCLYVYVHISIFCTIFRNQGPTHPNRMVDVRQFLKRLCHDLCSRPLSALCDRTDSSFFLLTTLKWFLNLV